MNTTLTAMTDEELESIEQAHVGDYLGNGWTQDYIEGNGDEPAYYRVATATGTVLATVPDWAGSIALFLVEAHDYVPKLLAEITRLRAENERLRAAQPVIVRPTDSIDADEWSIITSRRQLIDTIRAWLGNINPELLHHLTHSTTDIPGQIVDDLPGAVDELIDRIKGLT